MATYRGTITSDEIGGQWQLCFDVYEGDYDIVSNSSPITLNLHVRRTRSYYGDNGGNYSGQLRVDGEWGGNYSGSISYPTGIGTDWLYLTSISTTAYHNSDGSYSPNISISYSGNFAPFSYGGSYSGYVTLSTIPRATPAPNVTCDVENTTTFTLSPYASFSHSVQIAFGSYARYLKANGDLSTSEVKYASTVKTWTFNATSDYYTRFSGKNGTGTITVRTYSGTSLIGTSSGTLTLIANQSLCSPVITGSVVDTLDKTNLGLTTNDIIKYVSTPKLTTTIQISSKNDSNASLTFLQVAGNTISDLTKRTFDIQNPLSNSFLVKVINSRTYPTEQPIAASGKFIEYVLPTITITSAARTEPTTGDAYIDYKGDFYNGNFGNNVPNTLTVSWKYKEKSATEYTEGGIVVPTIKNNTFSGTINVDGLFDYRKQYDIIVLAEDLIKEAANTTELARGYPIFWWSENFVDILGELRINGNNPFLYNEDETIVGKWYDGNDLYRKVLNIGDYTWDGSTHEFIHGIDNLDTAVSLKILGYYPTYKRWYVNWDRLDTNNWTVSSDKIYIKCTSSTSADFTRVALIIEYTKNTKTTDTGEV